MVEMISKQRQKMLCCMDISTKGYAWTSCAVLQYLDHKVTSSSVSQQKGKSVGWQHLSRGNSMASRPFRRRVELSFLQMWKVGQSLATGMRAPLKLWTTGDATSVAGLGIWQMLVEFAGPRAWEVQAEQVQAALVQRPSRSKANLLSKIPLDSSLRPQAASTRETGISSV